MDIAMAEVVVQNHTEVGETALESVPRRRAGASVPPRRRDIISSSAMTIPTTLRSSSGAGGLPHTPSWATISRGGFTANPEPWGFSMGDFG